MSRQILVVGNDDDGWNVEAEISGKTVIFACISKEDANALQDLLTDCSWFQIEDRQLGPSALLFD